MEHEIRRRRPTFWITGQGNPADRRAAVHYAALAKVAVAAVKSVNSSVKVLVGAFGVDDGRQWTQAMVRYGALGGAHGVSVHVYNQCRREDRRREDQRNAPEMIDGLRSSQDMLRRETKRASVPIYVT